MKIAYKLFFQTLGKFNQQTCKKSLTKNAAQASRKENFYQKNSVFFLLAQVFFFPKKEKVL